MNYPNHIFNHISIPSKGIIRCLLNCTQIALYSPLFIFILFFFIQQTILFLFIPFPVFSSESIQFPMFRGMEMFFCNIPQI